MPIPLPLIMAAIQAGGEAISNTAGSAKGLADAAAMMTPEEEAELEALRRKAERDALGLDPEERQELERNIFGQMGASERESLARESDAIASSGLSGGDIARAMQTGRESRREARLAGGEKLTKAEREEAEREKQELFALAQQEADQTAARQKAILNLIGAGAGAAVDASGTVGEAKLGLESQQRLQQGFDSLEGDGLDTSQLSEEEAAELEELLNSLGV